MHIFGFSTGALDLDNFQRGLSLLRESRAPAVELSALRFHELEPLLEALDSLELETFEYVSVHAPSRLDARTERRAAMLLERVAQRQWPVILHPDAINDYGCWRGFGALLCLENMDARKATARTAAELQQFFEKLPEASLCFDAGHARHVDATMQEAARILDAFAPCLREIHVSDVAASGAHQPLAPACVADFRKIARLLPESAAVILEMPIPASEMEAQLRLARESLAI